MSSFDDAQLDVMLGLFGPPRLRYTPLKPTARQEAFMLLPQKEVLFGGGAGGGKSVALLMGALQYADVPGYHALLLRPSLAELHLPGGLIDLSHEWLAGTKAKWSGSNSKWTFPGPGMLGRGGATLTFGYLANEEDASRYSGTNFSFLGWDELSRFDENQYTRMFRVLRQSIGKRLAAAPDGTTLAEVPIRIRATSNPGGRGHMFVKDRFVDAETRVPGVGYLASTLADNPHIDRDEYIATLSHLPNDLRERLLYGNWEAPDDGELFQREWFELIEAGDVPERGCKAVRYWDLAATVPSPVNRDPDYTVGLKLLFHKKSGTYYITDIVRERLAPGDVQLLVRATAEQDGKNVSIFIEQEPGSAGVHAVDHILRHVVTGYEARGRPVTGDKMQRAQPVAAAAQNGFVKLVRGRNTREFLAEICAFPRGRHDDCVDALSGAHTNTDIRTTFPMRTFVPRGRIDGKTSDLLPDLNMDSNPDSDVSPVTGCEIHTPTRPPRNGTWGQGTTNETMHPPRHHDAGAVPLQANAS